MLKCMILKWLRWLINRWEVFLVVCATVGVRQALQTSGCGHIYQSLYMPCATQQGNQPSVIQRSFLQGACPQPGGETKLEMCVLIAAKREEGLGVGRMGKVTLESVSLKHFFPWEQTLEHWDGTRFLSLGTTATEPKHLSYGSSLCQVGCQHSWPFPHRGWDCIHISELLTQDVYRQGMIDKGECTRDIYSEGYGLGS